MDGEIEGPGATYWDEPDSYSEASGLDVEKRRPAVGNRSADRAGCGEECSVRRSTFQPEDGRGLHPWLHWPP